MARNTDRWVTPAVVIVGLLVGGVIVLGALAAVTWLTAQGRDPGPMLDLVTKVTTAVGSLGALALQLANRATVTKVERNTSPLAPGGVPLVVDPPMVTEPLYGRHGRRRPPPPNRAAPEARGS